MSHQVTYRYYIGVFAFLNEKYADAEKELSFAFQHCHRYAYRNQEWVQLDIWTLTSCLMLFLVDAPRRILSYLIPLRLLHGVLPSPKLLSNYQRLSDLYGSFVEAYKNGDLKMYDDTLLDRRGALVRRGTFLVIERAREGCLRTLFKKVYVVFAALRDDRAEASILIQLALFWEGEPPACIDGSAGISSC